MLLKQQILNSLNSGCKITKTLYEIPLLIQDLKSSHTFSMDHEFTAATTILTRKSKPKSFKYAVDSARFPFQNTWIEYSMADREVEEHNPRDLPIVDKVGFLVRCTPESHNTGIVHLFWSFKIPAPDVPTWICSVMAYKFDLSVNAVAKNINDKIPTNRSQDYINYLQNVKRTLDGYSQQDRDAVEEISQKFDETVSDYHYPFINKIMKYPNSKHASLKLIEDARMDWAGEAMMLIGAVTLLNTRNLSLIETAHIKPKHKISSAYKGVEYRICKINTTRFTPPGSPLGTPSANQSLLRLHMVRGHFKIRKSGTYWWNEFPRGSFEKGEIIKDYSLQNG